MERIKKSIKLVLCFVIYRTGLLHLYLKWFFLRKKSFPVVIINYHSFVRDLNGVIETRPSVTHLIDDFKREVQFLKSFFNIVSLDEVVTTLQSGKSFTKPTVVITIDDGYRDNYELLFPVLKEHQIPVIIFLSTGVIGTNAKNWYDRLANVILKTPKVSASIGDNNGNKRIALRSIKEKRRAYERIVEQLKDVTIDRRDQYLKLIAKDLGEINDNKTLMLNWDDVRMMRDAHISFGAHTHTHPILTQMPLEAAKRDILDSKKKIESELGMEVKHFAYPNGRKCDFNKELEQYCRQIGFSSISTFLYGHNNMVSDVLALKRIGPESPISLFAVNVVRAFLIKNRD